MKTILTLLALVIALAVGVSIGIKSRSPIPPKSDSGDSRKLLFYQDSMHPWVKSGQPGKCSVCGMELTPIYESQSGLAVADGSVLLSSNTITVLNVQTDVVKSRGVGRTLNVAGTLEADESRKTIVAAPAAGRIDDLTVTYAGIDVHEGERLVTFYSPELTLEKRRFLVRARMSVQKDPTGGLARTPTDSDPYYSDLISPQSGTVVERKVYKGQYVTDGEPLFTIVDLSVLWFRFDVYEQQLPWLALGQTIDVTVTAVPGKVFPAVITFIEPMLNESTRTIKVRADLANPVIEINGHKQHLLSLGMYAQGDVRAEFQSVVAVPRSAVIQPGRVPYVFIDKGDGIYQKRKVKLGHQGDGMWEVRQGLELGDRVVTSGNVLIDAQAQFSQSGEPQEQDQRNVAMEQEGVRPASIPAHVGQPVPGDASETMHAKMTMGADADGQKSFARQDDAGANSSPALPPSKTHSRQPFNPRKVLARPSVSASEPGFRNNRLGMADSAFDSAFNRVVELRSGEMAGDQQRKASGHLNLTAAQSQKLQALVLVADGMGQALAADSLEKCTNCEARLAEVMAPVEAEFGSTQPYGELVHRLSRASQSLSADNLTQARKQFLPFSTALVELVRQAGRDEKAFALLKIYHCPMAPPPGLWLQTQGPLANPFFGKEMLHCGEEVKPEVDLALQQP
jgi:Cu(I)/Ag(I) efflux system membrane fusion protein